MREGAGLKDAVSLYMTLCNVLNSNTIKYSIVILMQHVSFVVIIFLLGSFDILIDLVRFTFMRMVILFVVISGFYLVNDILLGVLSEAFINPGVLLNRMYAVVVDKKPTVGDSLFRVHEIIMKNPSRVKEFLRYNREWVALLLDDMLKHKSLSRLVYLMFPYVLYLGSLVSIIELYSLIIRILLVIDTIVLFVLFFFIYRDLVLPNIILSKWLMPDSLSYNLGHLVFSTYTNGHIRRITNQMVVMLDVYADDKMGSIQNIILIQLFTHFNMFLYRSIPLLLWPLFAQWKPIFPVSDFSMLIINLVALWMIMLYSAVILFKTYNDLFGNVIKIRRNAELYKLVNIKSMLLAEADEIFEQIRKISKISQNFLVTDYYTYLLERYIKTISKIKEISMIIKELKSIPQPLRKFVFKNWVLPLLHVLANMMVVITFILQVV